jgi:hypothetical protein
MRIAHSLPSLSRLKSVSIPIQKWQIRGRFRAFVPGDHELQEICSATESEVAGGADETEQGVNGTIQGYRQVAKTAKIWTRVAVMPGRQDVSQLERPAGR